jgi:DNA-binding transcriptional ArsR family regulator
MTIARTLAALSDDTRRSILSLLGERGSLAAGVIAEAYDLAKPTISHHLKVLAEAGLVRSERRGTSIVYTLQSNVLEDTAAALLALSAPRATTRLTAKRSRS